MNSRFPERDPYTGEVFINGKWWDSRDDYEDAADREAESRRDMELEDESEGE